VAQRAALREKGDTPHLLVMTATPIPRSLALTIYGDLDVSVIDEMPPGRQPVKTHIIYPTERERIYTLIRSQVEEGHQAFIIYPLVEQNDNQDSKAAVEEQERLQKDVFPDLKIGLLHGRLKPDQKESVMRKFRDREFDILVSTSVVEVGVDISNATVMVVEGANRFGLAQLHQFRGRVGRGTDPSYCILIPETSDAAENERLVAMESTNDGFELAEHDLRQRGPGEFLGTRQSGYTNLRLAKITDIRLIKKAQIYAQQVLDNDPTLSAPEHQLMREALEHFWPSTEGEIS
jgi:ATP-dependent DNA helicase RecG